MFEIIPTASAAELSEIYAFGGIKSLGQGITYLVGPAFQIAGVAILLYFLYAAYKMITAGTDKTAFQSAKSAITHAIIGFVLLMLMFTIIQTLFIFLEIKDLRIF